jgi:hypothetical protein
MARPQVLQQLKHGKILSKAAFPFFTATWNWLVTAFANLRGDREMGGQGFIYVDRGNEDSPIIRADETILRSHLSIFARPFDLNGNPGSYSTLTNCYYSVGGHTYNRGVMHFPDGEGYLCLEIGAQEEHTCSLVWHKDEAALKEAQADYSIYTYPLYLFDDKGYVICDLRCTPAIAMGEFLS